MLYKILADAAITVHFFWIAFLMTGAFAGVRWRPVKYLHIAGLVFAVFIQVSRLYCPLTELEFWLTSKEGPSLTYSGSFIVHYLDKIIYVNAPEWVIIVLTCILFSLNAFVYLSYKQNRPEVAAH